MQMLAIRSIGRRDRSSPPSKKSRRDIDLGAMHKLRHVNSSVCYAVGLFACETHRFDDDYLA